MVLVIRVVKKRIQTEEVWRAGEGVLVEGVVVEGVEGAGYEDRHDQPVDGYDTGHDDGD